METFPAQEARCVLQTKCIYSKIFTLIRDIRCSTCSQGHGDGRPEFPEVRLRSRAQPHHEVLVIIDVHFRGVPSALVGEYVEVVGAVVAVEVVPVVLPRDVALLRAQHTRNFNTCRSNHVCCH